MSRELAVIIGTGGMGMACARTLGPGRHLLLADPHAPTLSAKAETLRQEGLIVTERQLDVGDGAAVEAFASEAARLGSLGLLLHTAGRSPGDSDAEMILNVNLLGAAFVLDAFLPLAQHGAAAIVISSIAGYMIEITHEVESQLALAPTNRLMDAARAVPGHDTPYTAYALSKRANQLRVEAGALAWGARGARLLSISPGVIATPMFHHDKTVVPDFERAALGAPAARLGTAQDIAAAVAWLAGPSASFITGCDLRIDGGMMSLQRWGEAAVLVAAAGR